MMCPICDAHAKHVDEVFHATQRKTTYANLCKNGHYFETTEVHMTMTADTRKCRAAVNTINWRVALWHRNQSIINEKILSIEELAALHNLTPTRVRQIRASARESEDSPNARKLRSSTQKGK